jgi:N-acetylglutamate synthase-like GNAT family acetyltransferase
MTMMNAANTLTQELRRQSTGRVRSARSDDMRQLAQLLARLGVTDLRWQASDLPHWFEHGRVLVLDDGGALHAAAFLDERDGHARLALLVIDPARIGTGIEERMISVAEALTVALGTQPLEIAMRQAS